MLENGAIRIMVNKDYSTALPGFFTIPYNFDSEKLFEYFRDNHHELRKIRQKVTFSIMYSI